MAADKQGLQVRQEKGSLFLATSRSLPDYRLLEQWLVKKHPHLVPVREDLWNWQLKEQANLQRCLIAVSGAGNPLEWPAFPWIRFYEELQILEDYLSSYSVVFSGSDNTYPPCPPTSFYREGELICRLFQDHSHPSIFIDEEYIQINHQEKTLDYRALQTGYLYFPRGKMSLQPLEEIDDRKTHLYIRMYPVIPPQRVELRDFLMTYIRQKRSLYSEASLLLQDGSELLPYLDEDRPRKILFCQGTAMEPAQDARLEILKKKNQESNEERDYKELHQYVEVHKGEELAVKYFMNPGCDGKDLEGNILQAGQPRDIQVFTKGPVKEETREGHTLYIAEEGGLFLASENYLEVKEIFRIEGDVDYHTGNVEYDKLVEIMGDVKSGFQVISKSDIVVHGCVENGVILESGGDSMVLGGVLGENTRIYAEGHVRVSYLQDARLFALGNVYVEKNVLRGSIYSGGVLQVEGKGVNTSRHGVIMGGRYSALGGMKLQALGAEAVESFFTVGHNEKETRAIMEIRKTLASFEREQVTLMQKLPLDLNDSSSRSKLRNLDPESKKKISVLLLKMKGLSEERERLQKEEAEHLEMEYAEEEIMPSIFVDKTLFGNNHIQMGKIRRTYHFQDSENQEIYLFRKQILLRDIRG